MTGILSYGNYSHAANEVVLRSISKSKTVGPRGFVTEMTETWSLEGILQAASVSALTTAMAALEDAYSQGGKDLIFSIDGNRTRHVLLGSTGLGGPIPLGLNWENQFNAEYTTFRSYTIDIECRIPVAEQELLDFRESLVSSGGLPVFRIHELRNGPPIVQMVSPASAYRATQSGSALGLSKYPAPSPPIFGTSSPPLVDREIGVDTPENWRGSRINYAKKWTYTYSSVGPLFGTPAPR